MKTSKLIFGLAFSVLASSAFALPAINGHDQLNAQVVAENGADRVGANRVAADGADHIGASRLS